MELLKKITGIILIVFISVQFGKAQNQQELITAFAESYKAEIEGDYSKASEALKNVFDKDSYEINLRLGWLSFKAGLLDESESYYRRAVQLMPYGLEARFGLVYPLTSLGSWKQVIQTYEEILEIDPQNSLANYRFGLVYYGQSDYGKAEILFSKTVNLYPFDYDGLHMLAWTKLRLGKTQEAEALFNKGLLYRPGDKSCLEGLSLIR
ncbi:MAG: tetratricopeptide repeat protein [Bacteroidetes bacterium]|jgi:tetratricopeptide (TPR) repeat protein|nr:tetratricopeptide repeat protein [Bacteroidota bacterium]MBT3751589.1 tetratricopeptide repeat protein [Bacteroidota bacterium]MBT4401815.1 tetratricopeptide repeat protein [Bacteroidota bacterium]MBT4410255.1 tetratricopeptide repeat protein [Bacteroidota bacterium]MBT5425431.1 tetratricopeptide repeat protein [Bacteroidota bacterium]